MNNVLNLKEIVELKDDLIVIFEDDFRVELWQDMETVSKVLELWQDNDVNEKEKFFKTFERILRNSDYEWFKNKYMLLYSNDKVVDLMVRTVKFWMEKVLKISFNDNGEIVQKKI